MDLVDMRFMLAFALLSPTWLLAQVPFDVYSCVNLIEFREAHEMVSLGIEGLGEEWSWLAIGGSDGDQALATVELGMSAIDGYEPESWFPVASMSTARQDFQAFGFGGPRPLFLGGMMASMPCPRRNSMMYPRMCGRRGRSEP